MDLPRDISALNAGYVAELLDRDRRDASGGGAATRTPLGAPARGPALPPSLLSQALGAVALAQAIRRRGYMAARLDPLGTPPPGDPSLEPEAHGLTEDDLSHLPAGLVGGPAGAGAAHAGEAIAALRGTYASAIGYDIDHVHDAAERAWLRTAAESGEFWPGADTLDGEVLLRRLTEVETFERFLHRTFPGKTRFSIEGLDMLVPILDEVIVCAAETGTRSVIIGMAHRGRLNILAHILRKPYEQILAEFADPAESWATREDASWTGDVKYHKGARRTIAHDDDAPITLALPPNPSHLEAIGPIVAGMARAAASAADRPGAVALAPDAVLPVLIHGDAAFMGQGSVAETLNLSRLPGYHAGGTVHIIANNQLGFTTAPQDARSSLHPSDLAKGFEIPIVHVNADEPEACLAAARLAWGYRARFHKDVVIDLVGYRRWGHNEGDDPGYTQPEMYQMIAGHPSVRERWARALMARGEISEPQDEALVAEHMQRFQQIRRALNPGKALVEPIPVRPPHGAAARVDTAVSLERLAELLDTLLRLPAGFAPHPKLARALEHRREALLGDARTRALDWTTAEMLAFASILTDGIPIRLVGQDTERGTFSQRHAVFHDQETGRIHVPLQALPQSRAAFEVRNSPLSENAALAFEYGYNIQAPGRLVVWEAQYGDFINAAQVAIDEFVASGRDKWGQTSSLVLLLPHGHEGQGPNHSSARPERFLQMAAGLNIRVANPTTAAQYFHLLRRQALLLRSDPLPLVVLTPKGLLRHPMTASALRDLAQDRWRPILDDPEARGRPDAVTRAALCSGRVAIDLLEGERRADADRVAVVRVEQLYPFPTEEVAGLLRRFENLREIIWIQEEPENMGAWEFARPHVLEAADGRWPVRVVARPAGASPAEGSSARHSRNQAALIAQVYGAQGKEAAAEPGPTGGSVP